MATLSDSWYLAPVELDCADCYVADLEAHEGDANGRGIDLTVTMHGEAVSMDGMSVYLAWGNDKGGEGLSEFAPIDASNGRWKVLYSTAMQRRGTVLARVMIYLAGSKTPITGSRNFRIYVESDPVDSDAALSDNDFSVFQQAIVDLHEALRNFGSDSKTQLEAQSKAFDASQSAKASAFDASERIRKSTFDAAEAGRAKAETARATAESGRVSAESSRVAAESGRKNAETARTTAETARATAEGKRVSAESSRVAAETARATTEIARVNAESSRATAEGTRKSNETARQTAERARVAAETARETQQAKNNADQALNNAAMAKLAPYICGPGEYDADTLFPTIQGEPNRMYYVPAEQGPNNRYVEWMLINNAWEMMGVSNVEISPIATAQIDQVAADQAPTGEDILNLTGLSYLWAKVKAIFAPKSHAATATTYGAASASLYGHAKASQTTPLAPGTAAIGSEAASFARGDHRHPLQTAVTGSSGSCTGNAATATKLATARTISLSGSATGSASFDGSGNASIAVALGGGVVGTTQLANNAVTTYKIADSSITSAKIIDGAIGTADIGNLAVTGAKIAAGAVTSDKILDGAITTADIANNAVTSAKIADGTIATADLANLVITNAKLANGSVNAAKLEAALLKRITDLEAFRDSVSPAYFSAQSHTITVTAPKDCTMEVEAWHECQWGYAGGDASVEVAPVSGLETLVNVKGKVCNGDTVGRTLHAMRVFSGARKGKSYTFSAPMANSGTAGVPQITVKCIPV